MQEKQRIYGYTLVQIPENSEVTSPLEGNFYFHNSEEEAEKTRDGMGRTAANKLCMVKVDLTDATDYHPRQFKPGKFQVVELCTRQKTEVVK